VKASGARFGHAHHLSFSPVRAWRISHPSSFTLHASAYGPAGHVVTVACTLVQSTYPCCQLHPWVTILHKRRNEDELSESSCCSCHFPPHAYQRPEETSEIRTFFIGLTIKLPPVTDQLVQRSYVLSTTCNGVAAWLLSSLVFFIILMM
jgi:hypothetical protein